MGGPGSFSGLRIGFSIAKGMALALGIPFASIPTLDCISFPLQTSNFPVMPVISARKNAFFYAVYRNGESIYPSQNIAADASIEQICDFFRSEGANFCSEKLLLTGYSAELLYNELKEQLPHGSNSFIELFHEKRGFARELLAIAINDNVFDNLSVDYLEGPCYIRKTDAEMALKMDGGEIKKESADFAD